MRKPFPENLALLPLLVKYRVVIAGNYDLVDVRTTETSTDAHLRGLPPNEIESHTRGQQENTPDGEHWRRQERTGDASTVNRPRMFVNG